MAIDSIGSGSGSITALRDLDSVNRTNATPNDRPPPGDDVRFSTAAITDVRQSEQQDLDALRQGLSEASATGNVALAGALSVSDTLDEIGSRLQQLTDPTLDQDSRAALTTEIAGLVGQGLETIDRSAFNGVNLLEAERDQDLEVTADPDGGTETVRDQDLRTALQNLQGVSLATPEEAQSVLDGLFAEARTTTDTAVRELGEDTGRIDGRIAEVQDRQAELAGADPDVDTGLDADTAQQTALQLAQSLSGDSRGIANQRPEALVGLFR